VQDEVSGAVRDPRSGLAADWGGFDYPVAGSNFLPIFEPTLLPSSSYHIGLSFLLTTFGLSFFGL
jgi:hypothetical protein